VHREQEVRLVLSGMGGAGGRWGLPKGANGGGSPSSYVQVVEEQELVNPLVPVRPDPPKAHEAHSPQTNGKCASVAVPSARAARRPCLQDDPGERRVGMKEEPDRALLSSALTSAWLAGLPCHIGSTITREPASSSLYNRLPWSAFGTSWDRTSSAKACCLVVVTSLCG
jgi:hypothetical protein